MMKMKLHDKRNHYSSLSENGRGIGSKWQFGQCRRMTSYSGSESFLHPKLSKRILLSLISASITKNVRVVVMSDGILPKELLTVVTFKSVQVFINGTQLKTLFPCNRFLDSLQCA